MSFATFRLSYLFVITTYNTLLKMTRIINSFELFYDNLHFFTCNIARLMCIIAHVIITHRENNRREESKYLECENRQ